MTSRQDDDGDESLDEFGSYMRNISSSMRASTRTIPPCAVGEEPQDDEDYDEESPRVVGNDDDSGAEFGRYMESPPLISSSMTTSTRYDRNLLHRAVADAGRWCYGCVCVEVWALSSDHTFLYRPESGWWIDSLFHGECKGKGCQVCRLNDVTRDDYVPPFNVLPGEGLPGVLWSEASTAWSHSYRETLAGRLLRQTTQDWQREIYIDLKQSHSIVWRDVRQISEDPDRPWNDRLKLMSSLGLGWAAAVPFNLHGDQGIVVYMARSGVNMRRLQSDTNRSYLLAASDLIGAAYALKGPRKAIFTERRRDVTNALSRVCDKILALRRAGKSLRDVVEQSERQSHRRYSGREESRPPELVGAATRRLKKRVTTALKKAKGGSAAVPPSFSLSETIFTFAGVLVTFSVVMLMCDSAIDRYSVNPDVVLGPLAALMTLLYGLTAAPASQPRSALYGQVESIALGFVFAELTFMPVFWRQNLATVLAIATMVKMGTIHPPAASSAYAFASGRHGQADAAMIILACGVAIATATLVNNLSARRQYPIYWRLGFTEITGWVYGATVEYGESVKMKWNELVESRHSRRASSLVENSVNLCDYGSCRRGKEEKEGLSTTSSETV